jgi:type VI secretion system protein ImpC
MPEESSVAPRVRVDFKYQPGGSDPGREIELPLKILMLGDYTLRSGDTPLALRKPAAIDKDNLDAVMAGMDLALQLDVADTLSGEPGRRRTVALKLGALADFTPERLVQQVPELRDLFETRRGLVAVKGPVSSHGWFSRTMRELLADAEARQKLATEPLVEGLLVRLHVAPSDEYFPLALRGMRALLAHMLTATFANPKVAADAAIADVDRRLSAQLREILHHPDFQKLESAWRELAFLVDRTEPRANIAIDVLSVSKDELRADFEKAGKIESSSLHRVAYASTYLVRLAAPYGAICCNYEFGPGPGDMSLLGSCAQVAALAHAPFIGNASPEIFGQQSFLAVDGKDWKGVTRLLEAPRLDGWRAFREREEARYVGLCLPRFVLRLPYGQATAPLASFNFEEDVIGQHDRYLWGHASVALTSRITQAFAKWGWCPNIIGPRSDGLVEGLPVHQYPGTEDQFKLPTEIPFTDHAEFVLSEAGFIGLVFRPEGRNACFFSACSAARNREVNQRFGPDYRPGPDLPWTFVVSRVAHFVKALLRDDWKGIGREASDVQRELNRWLARYVFEPPLSCPFRWSATWRNSGATVTGSAAASGSRWSGRALRAPADQRARRPAAAPGACSSP